MPKRELQPLRIGYAQVSIHDQNLEMQLDAPKKTGCKRIFTDKLSGAQVERPGLKEALSHLREADTLVIWKLDRLGRSRKFDHKQKSMDSSLINLLRSNKIEILNVARREARTDRICL